MLNKNKVNNPLPRVTCECVYSLACSVSSVAVVILIDSQLIRAADRRVMYNKHTNMGTASRSSDYNSNGGTLKLFVEVNVSERSVLIYEGRPNPGTGKCKDLQRSKHHNYFFYGHASSSTLTLCCVCVRASLH